MTLIDKIIRRMHSLKTKKTFMEIEISNDDYSPVTGAQITMFMAKCMNEPLHCNFLRASIQYDEAMDWDVYSEEEFAILIAGIDDGKFLLPQKVRFEFRY